MKLKKSSKAIIQTFKSNGFVLSEPDVLLDSEYIIERDQEKSLEVQCLRLKMKMEKLCV